jgi:hypothetical protein
MLINLAAGDYTVLLKKERYQDYSASVVINAGQDKNIAPELIPLIGTLRVVVKPTGAIDIDGERKRENASDPFETNLPIGMHTIKVTHSDFGFWEKAVEITPEVPRAIEVDFNKLVNITVAVTSGWGEICVDGKAIGQQTPKKIQLRVGKHVIEVRREGYVLEGKAKEVNLEADVEEPLVFTLKKTP